VKFPIGWLEALGVFLAVAAIWVQGYLQGRDNGRNEIFALWGKQAREEEERRLAGDDDDDTAGFRRVELR